MTQSRWKSPVVWGAIAVQALALLVTLGVFNPTQSDAVNNLIGAVLQLLVAFGILNNPTAQDHF